MKQIVALLAGAALAVVLTACGLAAPAPTVNLDVTPASLYVTRGETAVVLAGVRRPPGLGGPIVLGLEGAPQGIAAEGSVPSGEDTGELAIAIGEAAGLGFARLRIVAAGVSHRDVVVEGRAEVMLTVLDEALPTVHLVSAAGRGLPAVVYEESVVPGDGDAPWTLRLVALGGAMVLTDDGRYEHYLTLDTTRDGRLVGRNRWTDRGTWTANGDAVAFRSELIEHHAFAGGWSGEALTVGFDLHPFVGEPTTTDLAFGE